MSARTLLMGAVAAAVGTVAAAAETTTYTYDANGRLRAAAHTGSINNGLQITYVYDAADNRWRMVVSGSPN